MAQQSALLRPSCTARWMKLVLLGLGLFLRVVAWEEMAHAELPALRGGMDDAWPIQDQDDFTQHPAYILERQVKDEVLRLKDRRAYRQAYHNFLQNLSAHLTAQNIAHRIVETANEPTEGLRYHQLIITPNAASPINILAQRLAAHHLTLAYAGMRDIYNHRFPKKHTMLVPYLVRREVYLNATTLFNQAKILEHPDTVALFKFIELMEQNKLAYLQGSCLLQVGEFYLPSSTDPQQPARSVMLDKKNNIFISRIPASRIHFISLYSSAVALAQQAAVAGQQLQIAGKIDEALIRDIFNQYHRLRLRVASRLSNLNAMTYTILHHPLWVRWKWGTDDAEGFIHLTAKPLATTYPNFYFSLKFLWPAASLPPDTTALLAHPYWQGIYRFMQQLYLALQDLASSVDQLADLPLAQQIKWLAQMQYLATLAVRGEREVATEPWPAARFAAQFAEVQPVILQLLNEHERQKKFLGHPAFAPHGHAVSPSTSPLARGRNLSTAN